MCSTNMTNQDDSQETPKEDVNEETDLDEIVTTLTDRALASAVAEDVVEDVLREAMLVAFTPDGPQWMFSEQSLHAASSIESDLCPEADGPEMCPELDNACPKMEEDSLVGDTCGVTLDDINRLVFGIQLMSINPTTPTLLEGELKKMLTSISTGEYERRQPMEEVINTMEGQGQMDITEPVQTADKENRDDEDAHVSLDVLHRFIVEMEEEPHDGAQEQTRKATPISINLEDKKEYKTYQIYTNKTTNDPNGAIDDNTQNLIGVNECAPCGTQSKTSESLNKSTDANLITTVQLWTPNPIKVYLKSLDMSEIDEETSPNVPADESISVIKKASEPSLEPVAKCPSQPDTDMAWEEIEVQVINPEYDHLLKENVFRLREPSHSFSGQTQSHAKSCERMGASLHQPKYESLPLLKDMDTSSVFDRAETMTHLTEKKLPDQSSQVTTAKAASAVELATCASVELKTSTESYNDWFNLGRKGYVPRVLYPSRIVASLFEPPDSSINPEELYNNINLLTCPSGTSSGTNDINIINTNSSTIEIDYKEKLYEMSPSQVSLYSMEFKNTPNNTRQYLSDIVTSSAEATKQLKNSTIFDMTRYLKLESTIEPKNKEESSEIGEGNLPTEICKSMTNVSEKPEDVFNFGDETRVNNLLDMPKGPVQRHNISSDPMIVTEVQNQIFIMDYDQNFARNSALFLPPVHSITTDQTIIPNSIYERECSFQLNPRANTDQTCKNSNPKHEDPVNGFINPVMEHDASTPVQICTVVVDDMSFSRSVSEAISGPCDTSDVGNANETDQSSETQKSSDSSICDFTRSNKSNNSLMEEDRHESQDHLTQPCDWNTLDSATVILQDSDQSPYEALDQKALYNEDQHMGSSETVQQELTDINYQQDILEDILRNVYLITQQARGQDSRSFLEMNDSWDIQRPAESCTQYRKCLNVGQILKDVVYDLHGDEDTRVNQMFNTESIFLKHLVNENGELYDDTNTNADEFKEFNINEKELSPQRTEVHNEIICDQRIFKDNNADVITSQEESVTETRKLQADYTPQLGGLQESATVICPTETTPEHVTKIYFVDEPREPSLVTGRSSEMKTLDEKDTADTMNQNGLLEDMSEGNIHQKSVPVMQLNKTETCSVEALRDNSIEMLQLQDSPGIHENGIGNKGESGEDSFQKASQAETETNNTTEGNRDSPQMLEYNTSYVEEVMNNIEKMVRFQDVYPQHLLTQSFERLQQSPEANDVDIRQNQEIGLPQKSPEVKAPSTKIDSSYIASSSDVGDPGTSNQQKLENSTEIKQLEVKMVLDDVFSDHKPSIIMCGNDDFQSSSTKSYEELQEQPESKIDSSYIALPSDVGDPGISSQQKLENSTEIKQLEVKMVLDDVFSDHKPLIIMCGNDYFQSSPTKSYEELQEQPESKIDSSYIASPNDVGDSETSSQQKLENSTEIKQLEVKMVLDDAFSDHKPSIIMRGNDDFQSSSTKSYEELQEQPESKIDSDTDSQNFVKRQENYTKTYVDYTLRYDDYDRHGAMESLYTRESCFSEVDSMSLDKSQAEDLYELCNESNYDIYKATEPNTSTFGMRPNDYVEMPSYNQSSPNITRELKAESRLKNIYDYHRVGENLSDPYPVVEQPPDDVSSLNSGYSSESGGQVLIGSIIDYDEVTPLLNLDSESEGTEDLNVRNSPRGQGLNVVEAMLFNQPEGLNEIFDNIATHKSETCNIPEVNNEELGIAEKSPIRMYWSSVGLMKETRTSKGMFGFDAFSNDYLDSSLNQTSPSYVDIEDQGDYDINDDTQEVENVTVPTSNADPDPHADRNTTSDYCGAVLESNDIFPSCSSYEERDETTEEEEGKNETALKDKTKKKKKNKWKIGLKVKKLFASITSSSARKKIKSKEKD